MGSHSFPRLLRVALATFLVALAALTFATPAVAKGHHRGGPVRHHVVKKPQRVHHGKSHASARGRHHGSAARPHARPGRPPHGRGHGHRARPTNARAHAKR